MQILKYDEKAARFAGSIAAKQGSLDFGRIVSGLLNVPQAVGRQEEQKKNQGEGDNQARAARRANGAGD